MHLFDRTRENTQTRISINKLSESSVAGDKKYTVRDLTPFIHSKTGFFAIPVFKIKLIRIRLCIETMSLREMGPQLKLPINVTKGTMPLQCNKFLPFEVSEHM